MTIINGRYKINRKLGEGQFTAVYHAHDLRFQREVALKRIRGKYWQAPDIRKLLIHEASTLAHLEHPAITFIHDSGHVRGWLYFVMAYMPGGSLRARLESTGAIPLPESSRIIMRLAETLDYIHKQGFVHRHLKSDSILFHSQGLPYLSNFFIAYHESKKDLFAEFSWMGSPPYMAPEQWQLQTPTKQVDIYQLGVLAFEMLSGKRPFQPDASGNYYKAHLQQPIPSITVLRPDLPPANNAVFHKVLAKEPAQRYATAVDFAKALNEALNQ